MQFAFYFLCLSKSGKKGERMELKKMMKLTEIAKLTNDELKDVVGGREPVCGGCAGDISFFAIAMGGGCNCGSIFSIYGLGWT
jgi:hypothetical protein